MTMLRKIQRGRLELALYILLPIVLFIVISVVQGSYSRRMGAEIARRKALLRLLPKMERSTKEMCERLTPFTVNEADVEGGSELTMRISQSAQERGVVTRSVKLDKAPLPDNACWADFKVTMSGEGTAKALIQMVDDAERSEPSPFRVVQVRAVAKTLVPETIYDSDIVMMSRTINKGQAPGTVVSRTGGGLNEAEVTKLEAKGSVLIRQLEKGRGGRWGALSMKRLDSRKSGIQKSSETEAVPFKLTGVIRDGKAPLAMTDQGLLGVGDESGGYRIVAINSDSVVVENSQRVRMVLQLYQKDGGP